MIEILKESYIKGEIKCPIDMTMKVIGGKWKARILWHLGLKNVLRYGELKKILDNITPKMLTQQLRELEGMDMINRKEYFQIPPKVEYSLTDMGKTIMPILDSMCTWSEDNIINPD